MKDTVLVVGQYTNARIIARTVRARGLRVVTVSDASQACDIICCEGAALVVLDLIYPDTQGLEVLRRVRGRFETRVLPMQPRVIVVADWPESAMERLAVGLGADAFLRKPINRRALLSAVDRLWTLAPQPLSVAASA